jgi:hypothetical protein
VGRWSFRISTTASDKTFFFVSYEALKLPRQTFLNESVPPLALRNGDLSSLSGTILDPTTGTPFVGKQIPIRPNFAGGAGCTEVSFPAAQYGSGECDCE